MKSPRRLVEIAFVIPWIGVFLLTPPIIVMVQNWSRLSGLPLFHIYMFVCWALLIVAARRLSLRLAAEEAREAPSPSHDRAD